MSAEPVRIHLVTHVTIGEPHGAELPTLGTARTADDVRPSVSSVTTRTDGARLEVLLSGDVDLVLAGELDLVLTQVEQHCTTHPRARVHLDVAEVTAVDAVALRFVENVRAGCVLRGARCSTSSARPAVERVLALVRPVVDGELAAS